MQDTNTTAAPAAEATTPTTPAAATQQQAPEQAANVAQQTQTDNTQQTPAEKPFALKVKYNHAERELTQEEAVRYAQLGMKAESEGDDPRLQAWSTLEAKTGRKGKELTNMLLSGLYESDLRADMGEAFDELPAEARKRLISDRMAADNLRQKDAENARAAENEDERKRQISEVRERFPELTDDDLRGYLSKPEIKQSLEAGDTLKTAILDYQLKQARANKINQENAAKLPTSVNTTTDIDKDYYSDAELNALTPAQLDVPGVLEKAIRSLRKRN